MLRAEGISKQFIRKRGESNVFTAVEKTDLCLLPGKITVLSGHSGSGKSTLLNMIAGLLTPDSGKVFLDDDDLYSLSDEQLSRLRNRKLGVIPQIRSALSSLTTLENVLLPSMLYEGAAKPDRREALAMLDRFGIADLADVMPSELSGGELRRMAIARALLMRPEVILADEPTGDLDDENTARVLAAFREAAGAGAAVLMITHDRDAGSCGDVRLRMSAGKIEEPSPLSLFPSP